MDRKILYIAPFNLFPQDNHGVRRCLDEILCFLQLGYEVFLVVPSIWDENRELYAQLNKKSKFLHIYVTNILKMDKKNPQLQFFNKFLSFYPIGNFILNLNYKNILLISRLIRKIGFDVIIYVNFWLFPVLYMLKYYGKSEFKTIYIAHNIESNYLADLYVNIKNFVFNFFKKIYYIYETKCWKFADFIVVLSNKEKRLIEPIKKNKNVYCIYPSLDFSAFQKRQTDRKSIREFLIVPEDAKLIVFHGINIGHNKNARTQIIHNISCQFDEHVYFFLIFGPKHRNKEGISIIRNIRILDTVAYEMLIDLIKSSDLAIVPLVGGAGFKGKILDYLAGEIPVVTTYKGAEGTGLINNYHVLISKSVDEQFAINMRKILNEGTLSRKLVYNSTRYLQKMGKERFYEEYKSLFEQIFKDQANKQTLDMNFQC